MREIEMQKNQNLKTIQKAQNGITLVALVITIVLIILATVTINMAFGDNGLITQAQIAKDMAANSVVAEQEGMNNLMEEYANLLAEDNEIPSSDTRSEIEKARDEGTVFDTKTELEDEHGNKVQVPGGFKIALDSGVTIQQGVVIEDVSASSDTAVQGSQYVWIPIGTFTKDDGITSANIQLARYTFSTLSPGTPTPQQYATNYTESTVIDSFYTESSTYDAGYESDDLDGRNATAKDLKGFIDSVNENGGYYIGRYESSYASGATSTTDAGNYANCKAASKLSRNFRTYEDGSMLYKEGTLWNYITQINASKVAINTYEDNTSVKSDLMNSYAWDTAIVYMQEAGNTNYANENISTGNVSNTGTNEDEICKISDMASNILEWTTEYSSYTIGSNAQPCVRRGGFYGTNNYTVRRSGNTTTTGGSGFRISHYVIFVNNKHNIKENKLCNNQLKDWRGGDKYNRRIRNINKVI